MEWKEFSESKKEYPEKIVEKAIEGFSKATTGLVELYVTPVSEMGRITSKLVDDFQFNLYLSSQHVEGYILKLMTFGYNVDLAPINVIVEETIYNEIFQAEQFHGEYETLKSSNEFQILLENVFTSVIITKLVN